MRTKGSAQQLEHVRQLAAGMFKRDLTSARIAQDLQVHVQTVRLWRRVWRTRGNEGLKLKLHPGRPPLLNSEQTRQLIDWLKDSPQQHGFTRHYWTTAMIRDLIKQKFDVQFNHNWVGEMLHDMGLSWQKPMRRARERNEDQISAWREQDWPDLLKKTPLKTV